MAARLIDEKIAYTIHPVPLALKRSLMQKGFKIIDAKYAGAKDEIFNSPVKEKQKAETKAVKK